MIASGAATAAFDAAFHDAALGSPAPLFLDDGRGGSRRMDVRSWCGTTLPGDAGLLRRVDGPVLDVGCGPGRLTAALAAGGHPALGIDLSPAAVWMTRRRGGAALVRDVFAPLPGEGRWRRVLLADGNIGIAGDPELLLRRCAALIAPGGRVLAELDPPGAPTWSGHVRLRGPGRMDSEPIRWAYVGVDAVERLAEAAALRVCTMWTEHGRWFAGLTHR